MASTCIITTCTLSDSAPVAAMARAITTRRLDMSTMRLAALSGQRTTRIDAVDALHGASREPAGHPDHGVVQIDRRVAMAWDQPQRLAQARQGRLAGTHRPRLRHAQDAVFVAAVEVLQPALAIRRMNRGKPGIDSMAFVTGVAHHMRCMRADDLRLDKQRMLERWLR